MLLQEKIAVASLVLAAAVHLGRLALSKYCRRTPEITCGGCGCSKTLGTSGSLPAKQINGSGRPSGIFRLPR